MAQKRALELAPGCGRVITRRFALVGSFELVCRDHANIGGEIRCRFAGEARLLKLLKLDDDARLEISGDSE